jgi:hypothetical protein
MSVNKAFSRAARSQSTQSKARTPKKRPAPFCIRLSAEERARLIDEAGDLALGAYIKAKLFGDDARAIRVRRSGLPLEDRKALAQALALLGQSRMANNLNQLAHAANIGVLPVTPETEAELHEACAHVGEMRFTLMRALGLKPEEAR